MFQGDSPLAVRSDQRSSDPLLDRVLAAKSETEREAAVAEVLAEHAYSRIEKILAARFAKSRLPADQVADLRHEVILRLVTRFRRLQEEDDVIESFPDYVATTTFNTFEDFVRKSYPRRSRLKNRTLYALTHDPDLAVWTHGGVPVCGLEKWKGRPAGEEPESTPWQLDGERKDLRADLRTFFAKLGAPQLLEKVVSLLSAAAGIPADESPRSLEEMAEIRPFVPDPTVDLMNLQDLRALWKEIRDLPERQRVALLLQARDAAGESVIHMLPSSRIATIREIAQALQMTDQELANLWSRLPVDDMTISQRLGISTQQVINLRRSARSRLLRRTRNANAEKMQ